MVQNVLSVMVSLTLLSTPGIRTPILYEVTRVKTTSQPDLSSHRFTGPTLKSPIGSMTLLYGMTDIRNKFI